MYSVLHAMPSDQDSVCIGELVYGFLQALGQILLKGRILDDGDLERIEEPEHPLPFTPRDALDLLNVADLKHALGSLFPLHNECDQDGPMRMRVDAALGPALECGQEERRAIRRLQLERLAEILALGRGIFGRGKLQDKDVLRLDQFLLDARRRDEDVVIASNGCLHIVFRPNQSARLNPKKGQKEKKTDSSTGPRNPAPFVETAT